MQAQPHAPPQAEFQSLAEAVGVSLDRVDRMSEIAFRLFEEKRFREATAVYRGLTVLDPENLDLYRGLARAAEKDNDLVTAAEAIERAIVVLEQSGEARTDDAAKLKARLAHLYYRSGRRREAIAAAKSAIAISPPGAPWLQALAASEKRASTILERTQKKPPPEAASFKRMLRARMAEVGQGQATLARALGYADKELMHVFDNGAALLDAGEPARASKIFDGLVSLDGGVPLFHLALARSREVAGDDRGAMAAYDKAVRTARKISGGADILADCLLRRARFRFARGSRRRVYKDLKEALSLPRSAMSDEMRAEARALLDQVVQSAKKKKRRKVRRSREGEGEKRSREAGKAPEEKGKTD